MKKLIALIMVLAVALVLLTGCEIVESDNQYNLFPTEVVTYKLYLGKDSNIYRTVDKYVYETEDGTINLYNNRGGSIITVLPIEKTKHPEPGDDNILNRDSYFDY